MIKLRLFCFRLFCYSLHDNERHTVLNEAKQSFYSMKNLLIINLKGKLQKPFYFLKMTDVPYLVCSLVC